MSGIKKITRIKEISIVRREFDRVDNVLCMVADIVDENGIARDDYKIDIVRRDGNIPNDAYKSYKEHVRSRLLHKYSEKNNKIVALVAPVMNGVIKNRKETDVLKCVLFETLNLWNRRHIISVDELDGDEEKRARFIKDEILTFPNPVPDLAEND